MALKRTLYLGKVRLIEPFYGLILIIFMNLVRFENDPAPGTVLVIYKFGIIPPKFAPTEYYLSTQFLL